MHNESALSRNRIKQTILNFRSLNSIGVSLRRDVIVTGAAGLLLLMLFTGVVTNRYRLEVFPLGPQPEHFAIVVTFAALGWLLVQKRARLTFRPSDLVLGGYLFLTLVSSLLFPPEPLKSVQYWARMVLSVIVYLLVRWLITATEKATAFRLAVKAILAFGVLEALFGIVAWFLYPFGLDLGVSQSLLGVRGPGGVICTFALTMYGTLWEPNVYASSLMAVVLVAGTLFVSNDFRAWRKPLGAALAIMLIALALNGSRAPFGILAMGLLMILVLARGVSFLQKSAYALGAMTLVGLVYIATPQLSHLLMQLPTAPGLAQRAPCAAWIAQGMPAPKVSGSPVAPPTATTPSQGPVPTRATKDTSSSSGAPPVLRTDIPALSRFLDGQTFATRLVSYRQAWDDIVQHPFFGNGADSFGQIYTTTSRTRGWISNMLLMALHDSGIIGLLFLVGWFGWFGWIMFRAWRRSPPSRVRTMVLALGISIICLIIAYQLTTLLWFGLLWWLLAILESGADILGGHAS